MKQRSEKPDRDQYDIIWLRYQLWMSLLMQSESSRMGRLAVRACGILPEMVKAECCEDDFLELQLDLVQTTWKEGEVPKNRSDAVYISSHPKERRS